LPVVSPLQQAKQALGGCLREIRTSAGLTQRDLARLAGWHSSKASRIEYGKQMPSEDDLKQWCLHSGRPEQVADLMAMVRPGSTRSSSRTMPGNVNAHRHTAWRAAVT